MQKKLVPLWTKFQVLVNINMYLRFILFINVESLGKTWNNFWSWKIFLLPFISFKLEVSTVTCQVLFYYWSIDEKNWKKSLFKLFLIACCFRIIRHLSLKNSNGSPLLDLYWEFTRRTVGSITLNLKRWILIIMLIMKTPIQKHWD